MTRVFIVASHLMFGHGLESLLRQKTDFDIIGHESDPTRAIEQIKTAQPDVIILYGDEAEVTANALVVDILRVSPKSKVIGLNLQDNTSYLYQVKQRMVEKLEDILKFITGDSLVPPPPLHQPASGLTASAFQPTFERAPE